MSYTLRTAGPSPFGRKVKIAADLLGLSDRIVVHAIDPQNPDDPIQRQNPLGKIPALILDDGRTFYDSRVVLEYLDTVAGGGRVIPKDADARFEALTQAALADGILDAAILVVYESRYRPDQTPYKPWLDFQRGKIERGLSEFESKLPAIEPVTVGAIGLACALGYLDFRKQVDWRAKNPGLIPWLEEFAAAVPAYGKTRPDA